MPKSPPVPHIDVLAGANGAGKSSIAGAVFRKLGVDYFDPDQAARLIESANPGLAETEANATAWREGRRLLERAIAERYDFAFETTLGGNTITSLLEKAAAGGFQVRIWFVGLNSVELHIERVRLRVSQGGHDIPEEKIRQRFTRSRLNLIRLLPRLTELLLYDNSRNAFFGSASLHFPEPQLILHIRRGRVAAMCEMAEVPGWAKPIVVAALKPPSRRR